jgi:hypothetical protein
VGDNAMMNITHNGIGHEDKQVDDEYMLEQQL